jgi:hypothetical protein
MSAWQPRDQDVCCEMRHKRRSATVPFARRAAERAADIRVFDVNTGPIRQKQRFVRRLGAESK